MLREQVSAFLNPMPLSVLRGVGAKTAPRLERLGLKTVGDVHRLSLGELLRHLGAQAGAQVHLQARGIADDQVYPAAERKSISRATTSAWTSPTPLSRIPCAGRHRRSTIWLATSIARA